MTIILKHHTFKNKDILQMSVTSGTFYEIGLVNYVEVKYGVLHELDEVTQKPLYAVTKWAYFPFPKVDEACAAFDKFLTCFQLSDGGRERTHEEEQYLQNKVGYSLEEIKQIHEEYFGELVQNTKPKGVVYVALNPDRNGYAVVLASRHQGTTQTIVSENQFFTTRDEARHWAIKNGYKLSEWEFLIP